MQKLQQHIHFMGISGIGMSGIAKILRQQGHTISGCDTGVDNKHVEELYNLGCNITKKHQSSLCLDQSINTVVYTSAIPKNHPELLKARARNINVLLRSEMLALLMKDKTSIAIAGSHGKTSTTALVGHILSQANLHPSIIIGGHINSINSNALHGNGEYLVAETDESDRSLLKLPKIFAITTNIDLEHLETYKNFDDVQKTFIQFINSTPHHGVNVLCLDDSGIKKSLPNITAPYITYGQSQSADIQARNIKLDTDDSTFDIYQKSSNSTLGSIKLSQAGIHYVLNAAGAIALSLHLNIPFITIKKALASFIGVDRRFSYKGLSKQSNAQIFDDYSHHPIEIHHALTIARKKAKGRLIVVFQPHRFSRTKHLWNDFIQTFSQSKIDKLIITDIYPASEKPITNITSNKLVQAIKKTASSQTAVQYCPIDNQLEGIQKLLQPTLHKDDLLLLLGAGKVNKLAQILIS